VARKTFAEFKTVLRRQQGDPGDRGVLSTLGSAASVGDVSLTLASTKKFPYAGCGVLEGDIFTWSGKTATTLTGIPATGKGALTGDHPSTGVEVMACLISEDDLEEWLSEAIDEYNVHRPYKTTGTITAVDGTRRYDAPSDALRISKLVHIDTGNESETEYSFSVEELDDGYKIDLGHYWSDDDTTLTVYYEKSHTTFRGAAETDTSTVPERDEWLILLYAKACIHRQRAEDAAAWKKWRRLQQSSDPSCTQKAQREMWQRLEAQFKANLRRPHFSQGGRTLKPPGETVSKTYRFPFGNVEDP